MGDEIDESTLVNIFTYFDDWEPATVAKALRQGALTATSPGWICGTESQAGARHRREPASPA